MADQHELNAIDKLSDSICFMAESLERSTERTLLHAMKEERHRLRMQLEDIDPRDEIRGRPLLDRIEELSIDIEELENAGK